MRLWPHGHVMLMTYWPELSASLTMLSGGRGGITRQIYRRSAVDCFCITHTVFGAAENCIAARICGHDDHAFAGFHAP